MSKKERKKVGDTSCCRLKEGSLVRREKRLERKAKIAGKNPRLPRKISACSGSANRVSARDRGSILILKTQESSANCANSIFTKFFGVQN